MIRKKNFYLSILFEIKEYICICSDYQRVHIYHHKLYNKFYFILSNDKTSFCTMIMNFIIDISSTRNSYINRIYNAILILMKKLIKYATYIAIIKKLNTKNFTKLLRYKFILHYNMMRDIISNRNSLFTNHFWSTLCWHLNARCQFNTTFHSQIDNQIEK